MEERPFASEHEQKLFVLDVYFRTQAAIEAFFGRAGLQTWIERVAAGMAATVIQTVPDILNRAQRLLGGLNMMLHVYPGSEATLTEIPGGVQLEVRRCGIYDYRDKARDRGVKLTLEKPCEFCVPLHKAEAALLGVEISNQLRDHGCTYVALVPKEATDGN